MHRILDSRAYYCRLERVLQEIFNSPVSPPFSLCFPRTILKVSFPIVQKLNRFRRCEIMSKKCQNFQGENNGERCSVRKIRIRTRKRREKISSFFKFGGYLKILLEYIFILPFRMVALRSVSFTACYIIFSFVLFLRGILCPRCQRTSGCLLNFCILVRFEWLVVWDQAATSNSAATVNDFWIPFCGDPFS